MPRQDKPKFVYVTYIASTPEQVWQALTDPSVTEKYWYGFRVAANGRPGEYMTAIDPDGKEVHRDVRRATLARDHRHRTAQGSGASHRHA
jgi:uncharacterized protein YndB with AHSA1/START domain